MAAGARRTAIDVSGVVLTAPGGERVGLARPGVDVVVLMRHRH